VQLVGLNYKEIRYDARSHESKIKYCKCLAAQV